MLRKDKIKALHLHPNEEFLVKIIPYTSEFRANIAKEFLEVLESAPDGKLLFDKLTPGRKRNIIIFISRIKSSQLKIEKPSFS